MTDFMKAWSVSEKAFPHDGNDAEKLAFCLRYAILAPSTYNTQPWFFRIEDNVVSVYADRRYGLPVIDPDDRELFLCCAAAIYNLRIAIRAFGYSENTTVLPEEKSPYLLARVKIGEKLAQIDENDRLLFKAIPKRHTNRGAFLDKDVPDDVLSSLQAAATSEKAWLHICSDVEKKLIMQMVSEADHILSSNKNFRRELVNWIDPRRALTGDGMPNLGLDADKIMNSLSPSMARRFATDNGKNAANDDEMIEGTPVIAILGSKSGVETERIYAGQALMRVLLKAESEGLSVSTFNQPCEVPELRLRLHDEIEQQGRTHMILRLGYAAGKPSFGPRRALTSSLELVGKQAQSVGNTLPEANKAAKSTKKGGFGKFRNLFLAKK